MKHIVESVEEMYHAREPTGEVIVDQVLDILRHYKLIYPEDVALLMDVNPKDLRAAWHMLTGTKLIDVITHWRVMQAQEWIRKRMPELKSNHSRNHEARIMLTEVGRLRTPFRRRTAGSLGDLPPRHDQGQARGLLADRCRRPCARRQADGVRRALPPREAW